MTKICVIHVRVYAPQVRGLGPVSYRRGGQVGAIDGMSISRADAGRFRVTLENAESVVIGTHLNPDGDALGSALALSLALDAIQVPNEVVCHHDPPRNLQFLPGIDRLKRIAERAHPVGVILDLDSFERLGDSAASFAECRRLIVVDHHVPHEAPGHLRVVDTRAAATAVLLAQLLIEGDFPINADVATCLLTGIVTDTGGFRFRNTNAEALDLGAHLVTLGAEIGRINEEIFQRKPAGAAKLLGRVLNRMHLELDDRLCWGTLLPEDFAAASATDEDTEGFVNEYLSIATVEIAALLREQKPGKVRVSLRSRGTHDVAAVAREFGGGGHRNAAGCSFDLTGSEAADLLVPRLRACLESS